MRIQRRRVNEEVHFVVIDGGGHAIGAAQTLEAVRQVWGRFATAIS